MDKQSIDILWILVSAGLVFIMQGGFVLLESGMTRTKNSINVAIKNLTDLGISLIFFWMFGFALMFGSSAMGWFGGNLFFTGAENFWIASFFIFQSMFCSTAATIVSGAVAERMRYLSYILGTIVISSLVYPIYGHWVWGGALTGETEGWLGQLGFIDFAGSTVVHSVGGWFALAILLIIGPRLGRYTEKGDRQIPGSNIPMVVLGVLLLWFGWFGFNGGSTLAMNADVPVILFNTTLAAAAGLVVTLLIGWVKVGRPDITFVTNGALAGLVAITANCHAVNSWQSILIGGIGGLVMLLTDILLNKLKIDDAVGAIPVHLGAGIWGTLAVAIFGDLEILGTGKSRIEQLGVQGIGVIAAGVWTFAIAFIVMFILNKIKPLRVSAEDEQQGLNIVEHGASTEMFDLHTVMERQAQTSDISLRVPVEPFTEVGQIASRYNKVLDSLEENLIEKSEYTNILDNVTNGLFLLDKNYKIGPYYSQSTESIFRKKDLANIIFFDFLEKYIGEKDFKTTKEFMDLLFDKNISLNTALKLNPLVEIPFYFDEGAGELVTSHLTFLFKRIEVEGNIERIMVIVRDETSQVELAKKIQTEQKAAKNEMELFYQIIHIDPQIFSSFTETMAREIDAINLALEKEVSSDLQSGITIVYRHIHRIKGDADLLKLDFITQKAHKLENLLNECQAKGTDLSPADIIPITLAVSELQNSEKKMNRLMEKLVNFQKNFVGENISTENYLLKALGNLIKRYSGKDKSIQLKSVDFSIDLVPEDYRKKIMDMLIQLTRNSLSHGIEGEKIRLSRGKDAEGTIEIKNKVKGNTLHLEFSDDGNGLDIEKLEAKAKELYGEEKVKAMSKKEVKEVIFEPGLSTSPKAGLLSGRGVGLDLVKSIAEEIKAKLELDSAEEKYTRFKLAIPLV